MPRELEDEIEPEFHIMPFLTPAQTQQREDERRRKEQEVANARLLQETEDSIRELQERTRSELEKREREGAQVLADAGVVSTNSKRFRKWTQRVVEPYPSSLQTTYHALLQTGAGSKEQWVMWKGHPNARKRTWEGPAVKFEDEGVIPRSIELAHRFGLIYTKQEGGRITPVHFAAFMRLPEEDESPASVMLDFTEGRVDQVSFQWRKSDQLWRLRNEYFSPTFNLASSFSVHDKRHRYSLGVERGVVRFGLGENPFIHVDVTTSSDSSHRSMSVATTYPYVPKDDDFVASFREGRRWVMNSGEGTIPGYYGRLCAQEALGLIP